MPKVKLETTDVRKSKKIERQLMQYNFPTIGDGITILASSLEEAIEKVKKLQKS